jgi:OOP family OmpA-OmpF porin
MVGLRYVLNTLESSGPRASPPAPPAASLRTYLVFFDIGSAALTDRGRQVVAEAALAASHVPVTRIELAGHADASGLHLANVALSRSRARAVAGELVRLGV